MRVARFHVSAMLLSVVIGSAAGCSGSTSSGDPALGTISANLVGQAPSGTIYRLREALITVTGPDSTVVWNTEDNPDQTSISANVETGDYSALVQDGWRLERLDGATATPVTAELVSDNPALFTVTANQRTSVPLLFHVDGQQVDMTQGYDIVLTVQEDPAHLLAVSSFAGLNSATASIAVFSPDARGGAAPLRTIVGPATTLQNPRGITITGNEIIVCDEEINTIDYFALSANGNTAPTAQLVGPTTGLNFPTGIIVFNGEMYIGQAGGTILVFPLNASGDTAPTRTISGLAAPLHMAIDNGEIYATDFLSSDIAVYPVTASGVPTPTRIIAGASTGLVEPNGILVQGGEIFVTDVGTDSTLVFSETANGDVAPLRVIAGPDTLLSFPEGLGILGTELYVTSYFNNSVNIYPVSANGDVAPTRVIGGPGETNLNGPLGEFIQ